MKHPDHANAREILNKSFNDKYNNNFKFSVNSNLYPVTDSNNNISNQQESLMKTKSKKKYDDDFFNDIINKIKIDSKNIELPNKLNKFSK